MKYENIKRANEICDEIAGHEKMLHDLGKTTFLNISFFVYHGVIHQVSMEDEKNEDLKFLATDYRNKVAQYYRNRIESLKTELEKL